jgi:hypothetical protein
VIHTGVETAVPSLLNVVREIYRAVSSSLLPGAPEDMIEL